MREWFTAAELAGVTGLPGTDRRVRERAKRDGWQCRKRTGRGGGLEYHLRTLPPKSQAALLLRERRAAHTSSSPVNTPAGGPDSPPADGRNTLAAHSPSPDLTRRAAASIYDRDSLWARFERLPEAAKGRARHKLTVVQSALALIGQGVPRRQAWQTVACEAGVSRPTAQRWHQRASRYERHDWLAALADAHLGRVARAEFDDAAWAFVRADYLRLEAPAASACYERLKAAAAAQGWKIPSKRTVERRLADIPMAQQVYLRRGEQALMQLYPSMARSVCDLHALQWINGDGYQHNVFVLWPDGSIHRPKTWFWQDVYSRRLLAWRTDQTEHTDVIRQSFGDVIERFGIPDHVTIDNTRAAANKWMTGRVPNRYRFKIKADDPLGLIPAICGPGSVHWTSVHGGHGHGQAKPVERQYGIGGIGEYCDKHPAFAGAYTGANPTAKPENYASKAIPLDRFLRVLADVVRSMNARTGRRTEMAGGVLSYDQVFRASYEQAAIRKATAEQRRMLLLTAEAVRVGREGTVTLDAGAATGVGKNRYGCDALHQYIGSKVVVRFDPQRLHKSVHAYTLDNRYIGQAECVFAAGFGDSEAGRRHNRARKQWMRAQKEMARAEQLMSATEAARLLPAPKEPDEPDASVVRMDFRRAAGSDVVASPADVDAEAEYENKFMRAVARMPLPGSDL